MAQEQFPETPQGVLMTRQDTSSRGGSTIEDKLADDIFQLYQYIEGDSTVDLMRMFTGKSRKALLIPPAEETITKKMSLDEFCVSLLQEMRQDRDIIRSELSEIKKNTILIGSMQRDIEVLRSQWHDDVTNIKERIATVETKQIHIEQVHRDVRKYNSEMPGNVLDLIKNNHAKLQDETNSIRKMCADSTARMNRLDLATHKLSNSFKSVDEQDDRVAVMSARVDSMAAHIGPTVPSVSRVTGVTDNQLDTSAASAAVAEMISSTSGPSRDVLTSNRTPVQASTSSTPLTITVEQNGAMKHTRKAQYNEAAETDELSGFIQVKGKPRFSSFFTAGIKFQFLSKLSLFTHDLILSPGFWPSGIYCRAWKN